MCQYPTHDLAAQSTTWRIWRPCQHAANAYSASQTEPSTSSATWLESTSNSRPAMPKSFGRTATSPFRKGLPTLTCSSRAYEAFQLEVLDMTCDIQAGLEAIAAAIENMRPGGACSTGSGIDVARHIEY